MGNRWYEAQSGEGNEYWNERLLHPTGHQDGICQNKRIVKKTIAALCAYEDQVLGTVLAERLRYEKNVDIAAHNQVKHWFEQQVILDDDDEVPRLNFIFEMLVRAFDSRKKKQFGVYSPYESRVRDSTQLCGRGWNNEEELAGWRRVLDRWVGKCGFCAGNGFSGIYIGHTLETCTHGGSKERLARMGESIHLESFLASGGCPDCGIPREFCDTWIRPRDGKWQKIPSKRCQYGLLVYDTVIGPYQCNDTKYRMSLDEAIMDEGDPDYKPFDAESATSWLCKERVVAGVECSNIIRQLWLWTSMMRST